MAIYNSPDFTGERSFPAAEAKKGRVREREDDVDSCSSSSIGGNSESSGGTSDGDGDSGEGEVQSLFKGPLDSLDALEEVLPIKRGISTFYCGKSKSFTSLADAASCSSIKEIVKPENAYTRKRKNLLAHNSLWDKNCTPPLRSNSCGISKRLTISNRSTLALVGTMSSSESNDSESSKSNSPSPSLQLPPLPPHGRRSPSNELSMSPPRRNFSPWRSFSLSDLQHAAAVAAPTPSITGLVINNTEEENNLH